jgi:hypothetical protein
MSDRLFDNAINDWLESGSDRTPSSAIDAVLLAVKTTPQERDLRIPRRLYQMTTSMRLGAAIAIVAVVGIGALIVFRGPAPGVGGEPTPSPAVLPTATPSPTTAAQAVADRLDITKWTTYVSNRYGFRIGHPADWTERPADHSWTLPTAAASGAPDAMGTSAEGFIAPGQTILVSAWSVAVAPGTTATTWIANLYCPSLYVPSPSDQVGCERLGPGGPRVTPVAVDGHAGSLVRFSEDTQAFVLVGNTMYVVACWRPEDEPSVAPYGGATRLLEGYISTMHLLPGGPATPAPTTRPS